MASNKNLAANAFPNSFAVVSASIADLKFFENSFVGRVERWRAALEFGQFVPFVGTPNVD